MYDNSKLRGRIIEMFDTISAFSEALGVSTTTVSLKLNNKSDFSRDDIFQWCKVLAIPAKEIVNYFFLCM